MTQVHRFRESSSPYIDRVWRSHNVTDGTYRATPDGSWDIIVLIQQDGSRSVMLAGQATEPMDVPYTAGTSSVVISFAAGAYLPSYSGKKMLNLAEMLPNSGPDHFVLAGKTFATPTFDTAEKLVASMLAEGLLKMDDVVASILNGNTKALSDRAKQRHFLDVTGLTRKSLEQIQRAQEAVRQLQSGKKPIEVAADAGFTDQAHLAKSLKKIMRSKPSDVNNIHKI
ncbi:MAG TPA: AraC family transcriptional regulator [Candidatus Saccharimonadales bacterium]|nr:AraC family transcriptional regulator [Candidatus Saccharimonadales bacterium]